MSRMIDKIRHSEVPANLMRTAARGALALPAAEMLEILVHLSSHPMFDEQAQITLANWEAESASSVLRDPATPLEVLDYFVSPQNVRPVLLPALLENPAVANEKIAILTQSHSSEQAQILLRSRRVRASATLLGLLRLNSDLDAADHDAVEEAIVMLSSAPSRTVEQEGNGADLDGPTEYEQEHAEEIAAEANKPFELVRVDTEEHDELAELLPLIAGELATGTNTAAAMPGVGTLPQKMDAATASALLAAKAARKSEERERVSTLQKIARLTVGERVQLAMKGTKDERFILVRDGSKVVCLAVLESPKLSEAEVEMFAGMKNVQENVLRTIASKKKFLKSYAIVRSLVNNPRVPIDVSLPLVGRLLVSDLKNISMNKNVSDTLRKLAFKMFREKSSTRRS